MELFTTAINGRLDLSDQARQNLKEFLLSKEGKRITLSLSESKSVRSVNQNKYYWGVVLHYISEEIGHSPEEVHDLLKAQFLKGTIHVKGLDLDKVGSTASLKTDEFEEYLNKIKIWAAEFLNVNIPDPEGT